MKIVTQCCVGARRNMGEFQRFLFSTQKSTAAVILQLTADQTSLCSRYCVLGLADAHFKYIFGTAILRFHFSSRWVLENIFNRSVRVRHLHMLLINWKQCMSQFLKSVSWCKNPVTSSYHWYICEETRCKDQDLKICYISEMFMLSWDLLLLYTHNWFDLEPR